MIRSIRRRRRRRWRRCSVGSNARSLPGRPVDLALELSKAGEHNLEGRNLAQGHLGHGCVVTAERRSHRFVRHEPQGTGVHQLVARPCGWIELLLVGGDINEQPDLRERPVSHRAAREHGKIASRARPFRSARHAAPKHGGTVAFPQKCARVRAHAHRRQDRGTVRERPALRTVSPHDGLLAVARLARRARAGQSAARIQTQCTFR